ncbi:Peptidase M23 [Candidatus Omnitrophus magneticus]|uniref:Peptidase M23 n=1 Tax=Candidatus Omnitrophus magneticus TaxID=1609969 RepID=A0A0F0CR73_9BACT|nr:Peptidase M23 [Candidatus Omnitrophus magneticus]
MIKYIHSIIRAYGEILFLSRYNVGVFILTVTMLSPNVGIAGLVSVAAAYMFSRLVGMDGSFLIFGVYTYNPLLVGFSLGYLFQLSFSLVVLLIVGGILTFITTLFLVNVFNVYLKASVLSLPFVMVSTVLYLACSRYIHLEPNLFHIPDYLDRYVPLWLSGYFKSLGAVFFIPQVLPGIIFAVCILWTSRILFILSVSGYYIGTVFSALLMGSFNQVFTNLSDFNAVLTAMAIGGIFLVPSPKSYILSIIAVCVSTVFLDAIQNFWAYSRIPAFTLSFNATVLVFVYVLGLLRYPHMVIHGKSTPEDTLDYHLSNKLRYKGTDKSVTLPFAGRWMVWQAFNGQWTHKGQWCNAYDFIIVDDGGCGYRNDGSTLTDYYAYGKPVLSPVSGQVVTVVNHLMDNPIGRVDDRNNWGNLVVIYDHRRGFFVEISHFVANSIKVEKGMFVEQGAFLGLCGNSGYSTQPHIHIQVQLLGDVGAYTVPFSFINYVSGDTFYTNDFPADGSTVEPLFISESLENTFSFVLDETLSYHVFRGNSKIDEFAMSVRMSPEGVFYFDSGRGKLYFYKESGVFYFSSIEGVDPYLKAIMLAVPRLPLVYREHMVWNDYIPIGLVFNGVGKWALQLLSSFYHELFNINVSAEYISRNTIRGIARSKFPKSSWETFVELDYERKGFKTVRVEDIELLRTDALGHDICPTFQKTR